MSQNQLIKTYERLYGNKNYQTLPALFKKIILEKDQDNKWESENLNRKDTMNMLANAAKLYDCSLSQARKFSHSPQIAIHAVASYKNISTAERDYAIMLADNKETTMSKSDINFMERNNVLRLTILNIEPKKHHIFKSLDWAIYYKTKQHEKV